LYHINPAQFGVGNPFNEPQKWQASLVLHVQLYHIDPACSVWCSEHISWTPEVTGISCSTCPTVSAYLVPREQNQTWLMAFRRFIDVAAVSGAKSKREWSFGLNRMQSKTSS
jgi:hypothetical protein